MAATTASIVTERINAQKVMDYPVAESTKALCGTLKNLNASGYLEEATDAASKVFLGVGAEEVDNSSGSDGDKRAQVHTDGIFLFTLSGGAAITDIGTNVYVKDNQTVAKAAGASNDVPCGTIVGYHSSTKVWVDISIGARVASS